MYCQEISVLNYCFSEATKHFEDCCKAGLCSGAYCKKIAKEYKQKLKKTGEYKINKKIEAIKKKSFHSSQQKQKQAPSTLSSLGI